MINNTDKASFPSLEFEQKKNLLSILRENILVNFLGSSCYILLKLFFNFLLIYKTNATFYGGMGYLFSYIFLLVNLASAPTLYTPSNIISPHLTKSKASKMLLALFSLQALLLSSASYFLWYMLKQNLALFDLFKTSHEQNMLFVVAALLVFMEGIRLSLRFLMHMINQTKVIVPFEIASMIIYMLVVFYFLLNAQTFSLIHIFCPFLFDSLLVTLFFLFLLYKWHSTLPEGSESLSETIQSFYTKFFIAPSIAHALSFYAGALLSDNMIIVSFMPSLGLSAIALPKIAAYVADSLRIMTKSLIGFSALPLFSMAKIEEVNVQKALYKNTKKYFFLLILFTFCAALLGLGISTQTNSSELAYQSIFFISLFFAIKLANQINYFYEKIMIFHEHSSTIIFVSSLKIIAAILLLYLHPALPTILFSLLFIKCISGLFYHFYVNKMLEIAQ